MQSTKRERKNSKNRPPRIEPEHHLEVGECVDMVGGVWIVERYTPPRRWNDEYDGSMRFTMPRATLGSFHTGEDSIDIVWRDDTWHRAGERRPFRSENRVTDDAGEHPAITARRDSTSTSTSTTSTRK